MFFQDLEKTHKGHVCESLFLREPAKYGIDNENGQKNSQRKKCNYYTALKKKFNGLSSKMFNNNLLRYGFLILSI